MKKKLKKLDTKIISWSKIVEKYPHCDSYKEMLIALIKEREVLASTIGRKK